VLDVACGTGVVARVAAQRVGATGRVVGVDLNPGMLAVARALPPPPGASIVWQEGSADALPLPEASFDVVFCQLGLQYFPDRPKALREMCRVLRPNGRMALLVWRSIQLSPGFALLAEALAQHVSAEAAAIMRAPFALEEAETLRSLTEGAGFHAVEVHATRGPSAFLPRRILCSGRRPVRRSQGQWRKRVSVLATPCCSRCVPCCNPMSVRRAWCFPSRPIWYRHRRGGRRGRRG
jgi:SAM-dependent methyltransferase